MASPSNLKRLPEGADPSRVPPGQTLTAPDRWPLLHFGPVPRSDLAAWTLRIFGLVEDELALTYNDLRALPKKDVVADIHCVTGWSRLADTWSGVAIQEILRRCRPRGESTHVVAHCEFGYTTSLPLSVLDDDDVLLCYGWNRQDLTPEHGFPLRLLVPVVLLEVGQVAARPRVHARQSPRLLGAARLSRRRRPLARAALLVGRPRCL